MSIKKEFCIMNDNHLKAVHDDDLCTLLKTLGCLENVEKGKCLCCFCHQTILLSNLGAIIPYKNEIVFSCDQSICLNKLLEMGEENDSRRD